MAWALRRRAENESTGPCASIPLQCSIINSSAAVTSRYSSSSSITVRLATASLLRGPKTGSYRASIGRLREEGLSQAGVPT